MQGVQKFGSILGAFAKLRKTTISFAFSASPYGKLGSCWTDFHEISYLRFSRQFVEKVHVSSPADLLITVLFLDIDFQCFLVQMFADRRSLIPLTINLIIIY